MRERINLTKLTEAYAEGNRQAAAVILADVAKYGGEASLMVKAARATLDGETCDRQPQETASLPGGCPDHRPGNGG